MPNRVVHFEIEAKDKKRAKKFYSEAFGWNMIEQGEDMGEYVVVETGKPNDIKDWGINGGIFQGGDKKELNAYSCTIGVENIKKAVKDVRAAGGKVYDDNVTPDGKHLGELMDIPGVGIYAKCEDTEGNRFTLLQPYPGQWMPK